MDLKKSYRHQADVALTITKQLFLKEDYEEKNVVFSPLSLHAALSLMASGSGGGTLDELLSFLQFDSVDHLNTFFSQLVSAVFPDDARVCFANGIWADESVPLSHCFKQLVTTHYKATLASLDFKTKGDQVCSEVNSWVEKETGGLITNLLPPRTVSNSTGLILANALHFKSTWKHKFDATPYESNFHLLNGTSVTVPFMTSKQNEHFISAFDGFKVLRLSYRQGRDKTRRFSMYLFLPDAKDGLSALIEKMASKSGFLKGKLPRRKVRVERFSIPKFKISFAFEASNVLRELGVVSPFSQRDADFTKMVEKVNSPLYIQSIFHKAFIEINEEDTKASASTLVQLVSRGGISTLFTGIDFVADHPFLFLIREDFTGTVLFVGQVLHPLDGAATPLEVSNLNI